MLILILLAAASSAPASEDNENEWRYNEITVLENGFLEKTAGDPYIVFPELDEPTCAPLGVQLSLDFYPPLQKPLLLEIFWSTDYLGFGEENKVFFIVQPTATGEQQNIVIPLGHTAGFRQIRLDFPGYIDRSFKVENYGIVPLDNVDKRYEVKEAYYNLSVEESLDGETFIPYLVRALAHGPKRISSDPGFLIFWLLLITGILFAIRFSARRKKAPAKPPSGCSL